MISRLMLQTRQLGVSIHMPSLREYPPSSFNWWQAADLMTPGIANTAERYAPYPAITTNGSMGYAGSGNTFVAWARFTFPALQRVPGVYRVDRQIAGGGGGAGTFGRNGEAGVAGGSATNTLYAQNFRGGMTGEIILPIVGGRAGTPEGTPNDGYSSQAYGSRAGNYFNPSPLTYLPNSSGGRNGVQASGLNPIPTGNGGQGGSFNGPDYRGTDGTGGYITVTLLR